MAIIYSFVNIIFKVKFQKVILPNENVGGSSVLFELVKWTIFRSFDTPLKNSFHAVKIFLNLVDGCHTLKDVEVKIGVLANC